MAFWSKKHEETVIPTPEPEEREIPPPAENVCRACSGGYGEGICSQHSNEFQRTLQRWEHVDKRRR